MGGSLSTTLQYTVWKYYEVPKNVMQLYSILGEGEGGGGEEGRGGGWEVEEGGGSDGVGGGG